VPRKAKPTKSRPLYRKPPPKPEARSQKSEVRPPASDIGHPIPPANFTLREDGSIVAAGILPAVEPGFQPGGKNADISKGPETSPDPHNKPAPGPGGKMPPSTSGRMPDATPPRLVFHDASHRLWLYHGNCLELLDAIAAKYPEGRFDAIFADPPYFLSNGGITCHAGRMVKVDNLQPSFVPASGVCRCSVRPPA